MKYVTKEDIEKAKRESEGLPDETVMRIAEAADKFLEKIINNPQAISPIKRYACIRKTIIVGIFRRIFWTIVCNALTRIGR